MQNLQINERGWSKIRPNLYFFSFQKSGKHMVDRDFETIAGSSGLSKVLFGGYLSYFSLE
jgi:hypothetical protein